MFNRTTIRAAATASKRSYSQTLRLGQYVSDPSTDDQIVLLACWLSTAPRHGGLGGPAGLGAATCLAACSAFAMLHTTIDSCKAEAGHLQAKTASESS